MVTLNLIENDFHLLKGATLKIKTKNKVFVSYSYLRRVMLETVMKDLKFYTHPPASGLKPKQLIVLLHGYGSNGQDLISLAPYWQGAVPNAIFISPDAPFACEMAPSPTMRQWFSLAEYTPDKLLEGTEQAEPHLQRFIDQQLEEHNLSDEALALVGFSQGTMMSLYSGPRRKGQIAGILGYSGALIGGESLGNHNKPPVHLIHGENDSVVPVEAYHKAYKVLHEKGFKVGGHTTTGLGHSIDESGIKSGSDFLSKILNNIS